MIDVDIAMKMTIRFLDGSPLNVGSNDDFYCYLRKCALESDYSGTCEAFRIVY
jgi:hypothetical protein